MTRAALAATLVVLAGAVPACSGDGDGGPPTDASVAEFCEAYEPVYGFDSDFPETQRLKRWGEERAALGTPEGIPDEARAGFEVIIESLQDGRYPGESGGASDAHIDAFSAYVAETCRDDDLGLPEVPALPTG